MIIDHRTYTLHPGRMAAFLALYEARGLPLQREHLGEPVGWYVSMDVGELNQVVHLWRYQDLGDRERRRAALAADPRWTAYLAEATPHFQRMENKILRGTAFFPIR